MRSDDFMKMEAFLKSDQPTVTGGAAIDTPVPFQPRPDPLPVDVTLSKIIVAYPWIECFKCQFVWPRDSSHDPKHNRQCPSCESPSVSGFQTFNAARMRGAYEWLEAKVIDTARRERARASGQSEQLTEHQEPAKE